MADVTVTARAEAVLQRGFETARLDPAAYGVRIRVAGGEARTAFAEAPERGDQIVETGGLRIFLEAAIAGRATVTLDVSDEHDRLIVR